MSTIKTQPTKDSVSAYINSISDATQKKDCKVLDKMMQEMTGKKPVMWGKTLIGYGEVMMMYSTGKQVKWLCLGFAPRKDSISIYMTCNLDVFEDLLSKLGKYKRGVGCLYIKKLEDANMNVLKQMFKRAIKNAGKK
jgi:Domain of unknown function (DU1801)